MYFIRGSSMWRTRRTYIQPREGEAGYAKNRKNEPLGRRGGFEDTNWIAVLSLTWRWEGFWSFLLRYFTEYYLQIQHICTFMHDEFWTLGELQKNLLAKKKRLAVVYEESSKYFRISAPKTFNAIVSSSSRHHRIGMLGFFERPTSKAHRFRGWLTKGQICWDCRSRYILYCTYENFLCWWILRYAPHMDRWIAGSLDRWNPLARLLVLMFIV